MNTILLSGLIVCVAATGFGDEEPADPYQPATNAQSLILPEGSHQRTLTLEQGESFTIQVEGNITTGYQWKPVKDFDEEVVSVRDLGYRRRDPDSRLMGAPGIFSFAVQAIQAGTTAVHLVYIRPWEENTPPVHTVTLSITVE